MADDKFASLPMVEGPFALTTSNIPITNVDTRICGASIVLARMEEADKEDTRDVSF
jgi:hypothetical protein